MHYRAALIDDQPYYQQLISCKIIEGLKAIGCTCTTSLYSCEDDLLEAMQISTFDVFFLDIALGEYNGIRLAEKLRKMGITVPIVFVSAMESQVFESFSVQPLGFIRKSSLEIDLPPLLKRLATQLDRIESQKIIVSYDNYKISIRTNDILYVESSNNIQLLHTASGILKAKFHMSYFEEHLPEEEFIRSHRCYIINVRCVVRITANEVEMENGDCLPISRRRIREIQYLFRRLNTP